MIGKSPENPAGEASNATPQSPAPSQAGAEEPFALSGTPAPAAPPAAEAPPPPGEQQALFHGLKDAPGQQDMFQDMDLAGSSPPAAGLPGQPSPERAAAQAASLAKNGPPPPSLRDMKIQDAKDREETMNASRESDQENWRKNKEGKWVRAQTPEQKAARKQRDQEKRAEIAAKKSTLTEVAKPLEKYGVSAQDIRDRAEEMAAPAAEFAKQYNTELDQLMKEHALSKSKLAKIQNETGKESDRVGIDRKDVSKKGDVTLNVKDQFISQAASMYPHLGLREDSTQEDVAKLILDGHEEIPQWYDMIDKAADDLERGLNENPDYQEDQINAQFAEGESLLDEIFNATPEQEEALLSQQVEGGLEGEPKKVPKKVAEKGADYREEGEEPPEGEEKKPEFLHAAEKPEAEKPTEGQKLESESERIARRQKELSQQARKPAETREEPESKAPKKPGVTPEELEAMGVHIPKPGEAAGAKQTMTIEEYRAAVADMKKTAEEKEAAKVERAKVRQEREARRAARIGKLPPEAAPVPRASLSPPGNGPRNWTRNWRKLSPDGWKALPMLPARCGTWATSRQPCDGIAGGGYCLVHRRERQPPGCRGEGCCKDEVEQKERVSQMKIFRKRIYRVNKDADSARLERIAAACNAFVGRGQRIPIAIGHTPGEETSETISMDIGTDEAATNFVTDGSNLFCDMDIDPVFDDVAKRHRGVSCEVWSDDLICPIALLAVSRPALELGPMKYALKYEHEGEHTTSVTLDNEELDMDVASVKNLFSECLLSSDLAAQIKSLTESVSQLSLQVQSHGEASEKLKWLFEEEEAEEEAEAGEVPQPGGEPEPTKPPEVEEKNYMALPSGTNTFVPTTDTGTKPAEEKPKKKNYEELELESETFRIQAENNANLAADYAARITAAESEKQAISAEKATLERKYAMEKRRGELLTLRQRYEFDIEAEMKIVEPMTDEQFTTHKEVIKKYACPPVHTPPVVVGELPKPPAQEMAPDVIPQRLVTMVAKYSMDKKVPYEEAWAKREQICARTASRSKSVFHFCL